MQQKKYAEKLSRREKINKQNTQNIQNTTTGNMRPFRCSALRNMQASPSGRYIAGMYDGSVWLFDPYACTEEVMARDLWTASAPFATAFARLTGGSPRVTRESLHALRNHQLISHAKASRLLDYEPRPFEDTIAASIAWFRASGAIR